MKLQFNYYGIRDLVDEVSPGNSYVEGWVERMIEKVKRDIDINIGVGIGQNADNMIQIDVTFDNEEDMLIFQLRYV